MNLPVRIRSNVISSWKLSLNSPLPCFYRNWVRDIHCVFSSPTLLTSNKVLVLTMLCLKFLVHSLFTWNQKLCHFHKPISDKKNTTLWFSSRRQSITIYGINKLIHSIGLTTVPYFYWIAKSKDNKYFRKREQLKRNVGEEIPGTL